MIERALAHPQVQNATFIAAAFGVLTHQALDVTPKQWAVNYAGALILERARAPRNG